MLNVYSEIEKYIFTALELEAKLIDRENELEKSSRRIVGLEAENNKYRNAIVQRQRQYKHIRNSRGEILWLMLRVRSQKKLL